ncbi:PRC-barrel domain-containing protein [Halopiger goleimassiliensis]|uniref:PRC-barrel domain-containing protein n=1 Tax=Halopiger goleimassiliensis TaxID=1293048 RepID=UPI000677A47B|nr:PRC-barrel domain-containing protein [Halopiger goleimassiliensis]
MSTVLAQTLSGKPVMKSDGTELGTVDTVTMDVETGELHHVLVRPSSEEGYRPERFERTDDGAYVVPTGRLEGVDDYLVVD